MGKYRFCDGQARKGTAVMNICYEPSLDNFSFAVPINQSNHNSGTREVIGMRHVA